MKKQRRKEKRRKKRFTVSVVIVLLLTGVVFLVFYGLHNTGHKEKANSEIIQESTVAESELNLNEIDRSESYDQEVDGEPVTSLEEQNNTEKDQTDYVFDLNDIPSYDDKPYVELNQNVPTFTADEMTTDPFEVYSDLDELGRCGQAYANICKELMPTEPRSEIGMIHPTGWHTVNYHDLIEGNYLYNRCHLIAYQLAGENANELNLITGTRYMNIQGMQPFENQVAGYVTETSNHVLYRVTPVFEGDNLLASGVVMEAESVEDKGEGICFNVYVYNVEPGIEIRYTDGESWVQTKSSDEGIAQEGEATGSEGGEKDEAVQQPTSSEIQENEIPQGVTYVLNKNTMKFHNPSCSSVGEMKEKNKEYSYETREEVIEKGYSPCGRCKP